MVQNSNKISQCRISYKKEKLHRHFDIEMQITGTVHFLARFDKFRDACKFHQINNSIIVYASPFETFSLIYTIVDNVYKIERKHPNHLNQLIHANYFLQLFKTRYVCLKMGNFHFLSY